MFLYAEDKHKIKHEYKAQNTKTLYVVYYNLGKYRGVFRVPARVCKLISGVSWIFIEKEQRVEKRLLISGVFYGINSGIINPGMYTISIEN